VRSPQTWSWSGSGFGSGSGLKIRPAIWAQSCIQIFRHGRQRLKPIGFNVSETFGFPMSKDLDTFSESLDRKTKVSQGLAFIET
jgi:hypothetical protein